MSEQIPFNFDAEPEKGPPKKSRKRKGMDLRDEGMRKAIEHADAVKAAWSDGALDYVRAVAEERRELTAERVREYAIAKGFVEPPDRRAWGAVMIRGHKAGILTRGPWVEADDPRVHRNAVRLWYSNVFRQPLRAVV